jgi:hypothetical protein
MSELLDIKMSLERPGPEYYDKLACYNTLLRRMRHAVFAQGRRDKELIAWEANQISLFTKKLVRLESLNCEETEVLNSIETKYRDAPILSRYVNSSYREMLHRLAELSQGDYKYIWLHDYILGSSYHSIDPDPFFSPQTLYFPLVSTGFLMTSIASCLMDSFHGISLNVHPAFINKDVDYIFVPESVRLSMLEGLVDQIVILDDMKGQSQKGVYVNFCKEYPNISVVNAPGPCFQ